MARQYTISADSLEELRAAFEELVGGAGASASAGAAPKARGGRGGKAPQVPEPAQIPPAGDAASVLAGPIDLGGVDPFAPASDPNAGSPFGDLPTLDMGPAVDPRVEKIIVALEAKVAAAGAPRVGEWLAGAFGVDKATPIPTLYDHIRKAPKEFLDRLAGTIGVS